LPELGVSFEGAIPHAPGLRVGLQRKVNQRREVVGAVDRPSHRGFVEAPKLVEPRHTVVGIPERERWGPGTVCSASWSDFRIRIEIKRSASRDPRKDCETQKQEWQWS
jgi:hypothetical protein